MSTFPFDFETKLGNNNTNSRTQANIVHISWCHHTIAQKLRRPTCCKIAFLQDARQWKQKPALYNFPPIKSGSRSGSSFLVESHFWVVGAQCKPINWDHRPLRTQKPLFSPTISSILPLSLFLLCRDERVYCALSIERNNFTTAACAQLAGQ